jgi:hypothetical protein
VSSTPSVKDEADLDMDSSLARYVKFALRYRANHNVEQDAPIDVYEEIRAEGVDLRFIRATTLEGLYITDSGSHQINVSAFRPAGLRRFTAAHELGHHVFGHGTKIDRDFEYKPKFSSFTPDERAADTFASFLLMPRPAISRALESIGANYASLTPYQVFLAAAWLGVGYSTLLNQLRFGLQTLSPPAFHKLQIVRPQEVKRQHVPAVQWIGRKEWWPLSAAWDGRRLHAQVGDVIQGITTNSASFVQLSSGTYVASAVDDRVCELLAGGSVRVSIARRDYVGFYDYMYLPEPADA